MATNKTKTIDSIKLKKLQYIISNLYIPFWFGICTLSFFCLTSCPAQKETVMTVEQIDSLCMFMTDEVRHDSISIADRRENIKEKIEKMRITRIRDDSFVLYLYNTGYTDDKQTYTATKKQVKEGILLRLAEGKLCIEEAEDFLHKSKYFLPTEMEETEYFFMNEQLVKISLTKGHTDYNVSPQAYWILVNQIDFVYHTIEPEKKAIYYFYHPIHRKQYPVNVLTEKEWIEAEMNRNGITEEQLKENAYRLYSLFISDKNQFNISDTGIIISKDDEDNAY